MEDFASFFYKDEELSVIEKILDEENDDPITMYDEEGNIFKFEQVAVALVAHCRATYIARIEVAQASAFSIGFHSDSSLFSFGGGRSGATTRRVARRRAAMRFRETTTSPRHRPFLRTFVSGAAP